MVHIHASAADLRGRRSAADLQAADLQAADLPQICRRSAADLPQICVVANLPQICRRSAWPQICEQFWELMLFHRGGIRERWEREK